MGKGWSKGLTAATDPRVAAMAEKHRGQRYRRRTPPEDCRWPGGSHTTLALEWSAEMAYVVGLTATDGCLLSGRGKINFKSLDHELVETYLKLLGRTNKIQVTRTRHGKDFSAVQFGDAALYEWLLGIGLTPRKSLTLGALSAPVVVLPHLVRGLLDGDGSILNYQYQGTGKARGTTARSDPTALRTVRMRSSGSRTRSASPRSFSRGSIRPRSCRVSSESASSGRHIARAQQRGGTMPFSPRWCNPVATHV